MEDCGGRGGGGWEQGGDQGDGQQLPTSCEWSLFYSQKGCAQAFAASIKRGVRIEGFGEI